jgi:hypothetical protein
MRRFRGPEILLCLALLGSAQAGPFAITNVSVRDGSVTLGWSHVTNRYIVAECSSLTTGDFRFVGSVLATNCAVVSNPAGAAFYRVRGVDVLEFLDSDLESRVRNYIPRKYGPTNEVYDIDVQPMTSLDCSRLNILEIEHLDRMTGLETLDCDQNRLTVLCLRDRVTLTSLNAQVNQLTNLNLSGCTSLELLDCAENPLTGLDLSACTNLTSLGCHGNQIASLDLSHHPDLQFLYCHVNQLTQLDLSGCTGLLLISCYDNLLPSLNTSDCGDLLYLYCQNNQLTNLNLSGHAALRTLNCSANPLTGLDIGGCGSLESLDCSHSELTGLDLADCPSLQSLDCAVSRLAGTLDISSNTALWRVEARTNLLTEIVVADTNNLPFLFYYDDGVTIREP